MADKFKYVESLAERVARDPALEQQLKDNPRGTLHDLADRPLDTDVWIYRIVVISLALAMLISLISAIALAYSGKSIPDGVIAIGSMATGALAGLLAPSPMKH